MNHAWRFDIFQSFKMAKWFISTREVYKAFSHRIKLYFELLFHINQCSTAKYIAKIDDLGIKQIDH